MKFFMKILTIMYKFLSFKIIIVLCAISKRNSILYHEINKVRYYEAHYSSQSIYLLLKEFVRQSNMFHNLLQIALRLSSCSYRAKRQEFPLFCFISFYYKLPLYITVIYHLDGCLVYNTLQL